MEKDFLAKMGINPDIMKDTLEYLKEEKPPEPLQRDSNINDGDIFGEQDDEDLWQPTEEEPVRHAKFFNSIGIDLSKLSQEKISRINKIRDPKSLSGSETTAFFKSLGVNMHKLVKVMNDRLNNCEEGQDPDDGKMDICTRVGRNDKCPCGSNKKYKKCCELK